MRTIPVQTKLSAAIECVADLQRRGLDPLVERIEVSRLVSRPIIRLKQSPPPPLGELVVQIGRFPAQGARDLCALHQGCQLRWRVPA